MTAVETPQNVINYTNFDLHQNEAMEQAIHNMNCLQNSQRTIESKIQIRMLKVFAKMKDLQQRAVLANKKMQALIQINAPLIISSPSKYVTPYKFDSSNWNTAVFDEMYVKPIIHQINHSAEVQIEHSEAQLGKKCDIHLDEAPKLIHQMYVQLKQSRKLFEGPFAVQYQKTHNGLDPQPKRLVYLDSLLVFNSKHNPYSRYSAFNNIDEMQMSRQKRNVTQHKKVSELDEDALPQMPQTMLDRISFQKAAQQKEYRYNPAHHEMPDINLPANIQGLDNVYQDDILQETFDSGNDWNLLPTQFNLQRQSVPNYHPDPVFSQQVVDQPFNSTVKQAQATVYQNKQTPQPQPQTQQQQQQQQNQYQYQPQQSQSQLAAPPLNILQPPMNNILSPPQLNLKLPPPLKDILSQTATSTQNAANKSKPIVQPEEQSSRANLMADIESANPLKRLTKAVTRDTTTLNAILNPKKKQEVKAGGSSLAPPKQTFQEQLAEQIRRRRQNMNPDQEEDSNSSSDSD